MGKVKLSEWLWRFLASVMLFAVGWTMWIFYQLNPPPLIMNAAFEAAAKAKANANAGQNAHGVISPSAGAPPASTPVPVPDPASVSAPAPAPAEPKEPPINPDKLKFSDSIATPAPDAKQ